MKSYSSGNAKIFKLSILCTLQFFFAFSCLFRHMSLCYLPLAYDTFINWPLQELNIKVWGRKFIVFSKNVKRLHVSCIYYIKIAKTGYSTCYWADDIKRFWSLFLILILVFVVLLVGLNVALPFVIQISTAGTTVLQVKLSLL